jgi:hypothetical protein
MNLEDIKTMSSTNFEKLLFRVVVTYLVAQEFGIIAELQGL